MLCCVKIQLKVSTQLILTSILLSKCLNIHLMKSIDILSELKYSSVELRMAGGNIIWLLLNILKGNFSLKH